jgi:hypothetical protein
MTVSCGYCVDQTRVITLAVLFAGGDRMDRIRG